MRHRTIVEDNTGNGLYSSGTYMLTIALGCATLRTAVVVCAQLGVEY